MVHISDFWKIFIAPISLFAVMSAAIYIAFEGGYQTSTIRHNEIEIEKNKVYVQEIRENTLQILHIIRGESIKNTKKIEKLEIHVRELEVLIEKFYKEYRRSQENERK